MTPIPASTPLDPQLQGFYQLLKRSLQQGQWQRLLLAKPMGATPEVQRVVVRPLQLRGLPMLSFVYSEATRDITKNLTPEAGLAEIRQLLGSHFRNAHLSTAQEETQISLSRKGKAQLVVHPRPDTAGEGVENTLASAPTAHDRNKHRWIAIDRPFLTALGITTPQHQLVPAMARKWKQINKFVEIFDHALQSSPLAQVQTLRVVDFGAGKAYLSFAVHDWLQQQGQRQPDVVGVELREELVEQGNRIVADLGLQGMRLQRGDVREWQPDSMDVMIALHACDTATDHALHLGIRAGASILLCSPCCHKQLRPQLLSPGPLRSVFQHGIHAEQQAEMITDSLRALLLDACGYDTQVFEFVALEHTRKNKMILAVKRKQPKPAAAALAQVEELKHYFGIQEHCLQTLLQQQYLKPGPQTPTPHHGAL